MSDWLRLHQTRDPRTDLPGDSTTWEALLAAAWDRDAGPGDCWAALHLMRGAGAVIREGRIIPPTDGEGAPAYATMRPHLVRYGEWVTAQLAAAAADEGKRESIESPATVETAVVVHCDGAMDGKNPGPIACGYVLMKADGKTVIARGGRFIAEAGTNNQAEYWGLIEGLRAAATYGAQHVTVKMDSQIAAYGFTGRRQVHDPALLELRSQAQASAAAIPNLEVVWVDRAFNTAADAQAKAVLRAYRKGQAA